MKAEIELQIETVNARIGEDGWMRIAPWGDYPAKASIKKPDGQVEQGTITQRITAETAADVVNDFRTLVGKAQRFFRSVPVYLGHPDFKASASQYPDKGMKGAVSEVEVRNDGLYAKPQFNDEGEALLETTNGLAPSAVFACQVREVAGQRIAFPVRLRSVGLTNRPNLPVETINSCGGPIGEEAKPTVTGEADGAKAGAQGADSSNQPAVAAQAVAANDSTDQSKAALALELGLASGKPPGVPVSGVASLDGVSGAEGVSKPVTVLADSPASQSGAVAIPERVQSLTMERATEDVANARAEAKAAREELIAEVINHAQASGRIGDADRALWATRLGANYSGEKAALFQLPAKWNTSSVIDGGRTKSTSTPDLGDKFVEVANAKFLAHPEHTTKPFETWSKCWADTRRENPDLFVVGLAQPK